MSGAPATARLLRVASIDVAHQVAGAGVRIDRAGIAGAPPLFVVKLAPAPSKDQAVAAVNLAHGCGQCGLGRAGRIPLGGPQQTMWAQDRRSCHVGLYAPVPPPVRSCLDRSAVWLCGVAFTTTRWRCPVVAEDLGMLWYREAAPLRKPTLDHGLSAPPRTGYAGHWEDAHGP